MYASLLPQLQPLELLAYLLPLIQSIKTPLQCPEFYESLLTFLFL